MRFALFSALSAVALIASAQTVSAGGAYAECSSCIAQAPTTAAIEKCKTTHCNSYQRRALAVYTPLAYILHQREFTEEEIEHPPVSSGATVV